MSVISTQLNVLGEPLTVCCTENNTGFTRDGFCHIIDSDRGNHSVCAVVTQDFLTFSKVVGNDLSTPRPEFRFPGLQEGDQWCLCAVRWLQAHNAGSAPKVKLSATHKACLEIIDLDILKTYSIDDSTDADSD